MLIDNFVPKENYQNEIFESVKKRDWRKVLCLSKKYGFDITNQFMWCYPTSSCTEYLKVIWKSFNISNILSIGCGSGLMEFILKESIGVKIHGLEVDRNWWMRHSAFIPLNFLAPDQQITSQLLLESCLSKNWNFALLFCYFNCREAFNEYVEAYKGNWIIIIGPAEKTGRYTEPMALDNEFQNNKTYKLVHFHEFGDNRDVIAIYEKNVKNMCV